MVGHQEQWEFLKNKYRLNQLSHAYLFTGIDQIGKKFLAKEFVKFINCISPNFNGRENKEKKKKPCGECINCKLIEKESYLDLLVIKSINSQSSIKNEKDSMEIDVSQIREINNFLSYKSYYGYFKAVIIDNADRMNSEAQNCFLKTLEEPKGKTIIILVTHKPEILLSTIFSRCQTIKFFPIEKYKASEEQQRMLQDLLSIIYSELAVKFQYAKKVNLEGDNFNKILEVLQRYFRNLMLIKIGVINPVKDQGEFMGSQKKQTSNGVKETILPQYNNYSIEKIKNIIRLMYKLNVQISTTNANPKLALEILLMEM